MPFNKEQKDEIESIATSVLLTKVPRLEKEFIEITARDVARQAINNYRDFDQMQRNEQDNSMPKWFFHWDVEKFQPHLQEFSEMKGACSKCNDNENVNLQKTGLRLSAWQIVIGIIGIDGLIGVTYAAIKSGLLASVIKSIF